MKWPSRRRRHSWCTLVVFLIISLQMCMSSLQAQTDSPAYQAGLKALTKALHPTKERDIATAIANLQTALAGAEEPVDQAKINLLLARCYRWDGQIEEAIQALEAVLAYDENMEADFPEQKIWGLNPMAGLGHCYKAKDDWARAIEWWEKRLEVNPDANRLLAMVHFGRTKLAEAGTLTASPMVMVGPHYLRGPVRESRNRLLVPAPELAQRLGVIVTHKSNEQLEISSDERRLVLSAGSRHAVLDGERITLRVAPAMAGGQLLVPLRFVAETFGHQVIWEGPPRIAWVR